MKQLTESLQLCVTDATMHNGVKGAFHGAAACLIGVLGVYNAAAWCRRSELHLAVNTLVYGAVVLFECYQIGQHCKDGREEI